MNEDEKKELAKERGLYELDDVIRELRALGVEISVSIISNKDSVTLGAPTSGQIKVHGDFERPQSFARKLEIAQILMAEAKARTDAKKDGA